MHRLFERVSTSEVHSASDEKSALDLNDIQGFILRGYRMPMVRHFLLTVGDPAAGRGSCWDDSSAVTRLTRRKLPLQRSGR